jgi:hypothetical protein
MVIASAGSLDNPNPKIISGKTIVIDCPTQRSISMSTQNFKNLSKNPGLFSGGNKKVIGGLARDHQFTINTSLIYTGSCMVASLESNLIHH